MLQFDKGEMFITDRYYTIQKQFLLLELQLLHSRFYSDYYQYYIHNVYRSNYLNILVGLRVHFLPNSFNLLDFIFPHVVCYQNTAGAWKELKSSALFEASMFTAECGYYIVDSI